MKSRLLAWGVLVVTAVPPAVAHRVDEYLQATILSVEKDCLKANMFLTAGTAVVPTVLAAIDTDGNGVISKAEERAYARHVLDDLSLTLNGARVKPRLVAIEFPKLADLKEGVGDIHVEFAVDLPRSSEQRTLRLENRHQVKISVYQVNCLASRRPEIRIGVQRRDEVQAVYELDYTQAAAPG